MKRTLILIILWITCLAQFSKSQSLAGKPISIDIRQGSLKDILHLIEEQTALFFSYEASLLKPVPPITFKAENAALEEVLERLLLPLSITYSVNGNYIILKKKNEFGNYQRLRKQPE